MDALPHYAHQQGTARRLNARYQFLIAPFLDDISGVRVLDLGAHDGRWAWAFAHAGARHVVGIEARSELAARFAVYPDPELQDRVEMRVGDVFAKLEDAVARGETFEVVAVFGLLYHLMDHFRLFQLIHALNPRLIIIDSEFLLRPGPVIRLIRENVEKPLNAVMQVPGQQIAVKAVPSFAAMEVMADCLGYDLTWSDWSKLTDRTGVQDYYRARKMRRASCTLRPKPDPSA